MCQSDKECGGINKDACESDFLAGKEAGKNEESSQKAHRNPYVGYDGAFDTLSCDDTHIKGNKVFKGIKVLKDLKDYFSMPRSSTSKISVEYGGIEPV